MPLQPPRITHLPDALVSEAAQLLREDTRAARLAAAQLLARGYELDEQQRREETRLLEGEE